MKKLVGGEAFLVPTIIPTNSSFIHCKTLVDTGAAGYIFVDADYALPLAKSHTTSVIKRLPRSVQPRAFDGSFAPVITHMLVTSAQIDNRQFPALPIIITKLGHYDMIIGRNWLAENDIWLDVKNRKLLWPDARAGRQRRNMTAPSHSQVTDSDDIAIIHPLTFGHMLKKGGGNEKHNILTSLAELNAEIQDLESIEPLGDADEYREKVPLRYHQYLDVFSRKKSDILPPSRQDTDMSIETEGRPDEKLSYSPLYRMSTQELKAARDYIEDKLRQGFIVPSAAPYSSPILMTKKAEGKLRFCVDYRRLNAITKKDRYPLPLIDELMERLDRAKIFTKLDIRQGFHRIRMARESEDLTTFRTRYGSFKFRVMPFGLTNGPAYFQRFMNSIFSDVLDKFVTVFVDDILVYSENETAHAKHVELVLQRLREHDLHDSIDKCEFHVPSTKYLGFVVSTHGLQVDQDKVTAVANWEAPGTVRGVQSFLGFCNFYRRFIRDYAKIARPLHLLTRKEQPFSWSPECQSAFDILKTKLISAPVLAHYDNTAPTKVETDASDDTLAGVLSQQTPDGLWHPVSYFSQNMKGAERNYPIHDKELLAVVRALGEWRAELEGLERTDKFHVYTDHRALEYFMTKKHLNSRQARWAEFLSRFHFLINYHPGKTNIPADILTRRDYPHDKTDRQTTMLPSSKLSHPVKCDLKINAVHTEVRNMDDLLTANRQDETLEPLRTKARLGDPRWTVENELLLYNGRLEVPRHDKSLCTQLLNDIHTQTSTAHPGQRKMIRLVCERFHWPGWKDDVIRYVKNCQVCQRAKNPRDKIPGLLSSLPIPERPWQHISMDFITLPRDKSGFDTAFVTVDRLTKKPVSIPCLKTDGPEELAKMFITHVYRHYGAPDSIVSDRGGQFVGQFWVEFCRILGIKQKLSTAHHPQTDGQTEITNQHIEMRLRPFVNHFQDNWAELLPLIDHAAALLPQDSIGMSPFMAGVGYQPRMSFDWTGPQQYISRTAEQLTNAARDRVKLMENVWEIARENMRFSQGRQQHDANRHRRIVDWDVGDKVWLRLKDYPIDRPSRKLADQQAGPFRVLEKIGNSWRLDLPASMNIHPVLSPEKLRKAADDPFPEQHQPPPVPLIIDNSPRWEVERILDSRLRYRKLHYRVKWVGIDDDPTWHRAQNFRSAWQRVREFHADYPNRPGPPKRLQQWIEAWQQGKEAEPHREDDSPA